MLSIGIANTKIHCADNEFVNFNPPSGQTCGDYMRPWINKAGGYLQNPSATNQCAFCTYDDTNVFLSQVGSSYSHVWRDFGILWAFIM
jgi:ATP-binding cassette subfamily G (WHITE) protein 2 (PDR)